VAAGYVSRPVRLALKQDVGAAHAPNRNFLPPVWRWSTPTKKVKTMRALVAAIALSLTTTTIALAASPQVEAAVRTFRAVAADPAKLKTFCDMMQVEEQIGENENSPLNAQLDRLLDQLGPEFQATWEAVGDADESSPDGRLLSAAVDRLSERCPD
jgi:hypothetical protein